MPLLDALTNWTAVYALGTILLVVATFALTAVGLYAAQWAKATFGQQSEEARTKREPHVGIWLGNPQQWVAANYSLATEDQMTTFLRWRSLFVTRQGVDPNEYPQLKRHLVCYAQNLGEGPALRVKVPYKLTVTDIADDGQPTGSQEFEGAFEMLHLLPSGSLASSKHLDVSFYPKWKVELLLDQVEITGLHGTQLDREEVLAETSEVASTQEQHNASLWKIVIAYQRATESGVSPNEVEKIVRDAAESPNTDSG